MRITCPSCGTSYGLPAAKLGQGGRAVRCAKCGHGWRVMPGAGERPPAFAADEAGLEATRVGGQSKTAADAADELRGTLPDDDFSPIQTRGGDERRSNDGDDGLDTVRFDDDGFDRPGQGADGDGDDGAVDAFEAAARAAFELAEAVPKARGDGMPADGVTTRARAVPDIESVAQRAKQRLKRSNMTMRQRLEKFSGLIGLMALLSSIAMVGVLVVQRAPIVAAVPDLAGLYRVAGFDVNLRGLSFENLATFKEIENGQAVLVVEGEIVNITTSPKVVPAVRLALRGENAAEIYAWSVEPRAEVLAENGRVKFRTRLTTPPDLATDIQLRFVDRRTRQAIAP